MLVRSRVPASSLMAKKNAPSWTSSSTSSLFHCNHQAKKIIFTVSTGSVSVQALRHRSNRTVANSRWGNLAGDILAGRSLATVTRCRVNLWDLPSTFSVMCVPWETRARQALGVFLIVGMSTCGERDSSHETEHFPISVFGTQLS